MKRDMDLIRRMLEALEADQSLELMTGVTRPVREYHVKLLEQAGFVSIARGQVGAFPVTGAPELTWDGQDFLALSRNDGIWNRITSALKEKAIEATPGMLMKMVSWSVEKAGFELLKGVM